MSKVYTFIELLSEIKEDKIKKGTRLNLIFNTEIGKTKIPYIFNGKNIVEYIFGQNIIESCTLRKLMKAEFELIEEDTTDSIEELDIDFLNGLDGFTLTEIERVCMEKQNEIIRKVNQLEKQLKENMQ